VNKQFLPPDQRKDDEIAVDDEVHKQSELAIDYPKPNGSFFTLAAEAMKNLPELKPPNRDDQPAMNAWCFKIREALRNVIRLPSKIDPTIMGFALKINYPAPEGVDSHTYLLTIGEDWSIPVIELVPKGSKPALSTLVICDTNREEMHDIIDRALAAKQRVVVADILSTGECASQWGSSPYSWLWTLVTAEHGERTLGLQVLQMHSIHSWIKTIDPKTTVQVVSRHRISGLVALVYAALFPDDKLSKLTLLDMDASLKDLLKNQVNTLQSQPMYCTGLLQVADIPELIDMVKPLTVETGGK
jgi:hypothetical protein